MPQRTIDFFITLLSRGVLGSETLEALVLVDDGRYATGHDLLALDLARLLATLAAVFRAVGPIGGYPLRRAGLHTAGLRVRGLEHRVAQLLVDLLVRTPFHAHHSARLVACKCVYVYGWK